MVSLEKAKALAKVLPWEPKVGDWFVGPTGNKWVISGDHGLSEELGGKMWFFGGGLCNRNGGCQMNETHCFCMNAEGVKFDSLNTFSMESVKNQIWLPSLSQLLAEIEKRGYSYNLYDNYPAEEHRCRLYHRETDTCSGKWSGDTPEDAASLALLYILRGDINESL